ncbi:MAG TPA: hypothetical protein VE868_01385 [Balneolaceae bacterium]|nr:hypothetical protein [Balneolaceae bacterium]
MIEIAVSTSQTYALRYLAVDFNGTLAFDGVLPDNVRIQMQKLADHLEVFVLTSDTFGTAEQQLQDSPFQLHVIPKQDQPAYKRQFVQKLGAEKTAAIGNGVNDHLMLETAALGVSVIGGEGAASLALKYADIICNDISDALELFLQPK